MRGHFSAGSDGLEGKTLLCLAQLYFAAVLLDSWLGKGMNSTRQGEPLQVVKVIITFIKVI